MSDSTKGYSELLNWVSTTGFRNLVWATDLDSTLLDPQSDPNLAYTPPGLAEACRKLDKKTGGCFFIITGRDMSYVDNQAFPGDLFAASTEYHNRVRYERGGPAIDLSPVPNWSVIDADLDRLVACDQRLVLRKKPFMRSLHYKKVHEAERATVKEQLKATLTELLAQLNKESGQDIKLTSGGLIFDMGPAGPDKGLALKDYVEYVNRRDGIEHLPLYFGDSPGDVPGAHMAHQLGGKFVAVVKHLNEKLDEDLEVLGATDFALKDTMECCAFFEEASCLRPSRKPRSTSKLAIG